MTDYATTHAALLNAHAALSAAIEAAGVSAISADLHNIRSDIKAAISKADALAAAEA